MLYLGFQNFWLIFHGYLLKLIFAFFLKHDFIIYKVLTFNHLAFGDKVRVLGLHIWIPLPETLLAKSLFQTLERSLNNWFLPKWFFH